ncbi:MAG: hypothetical protein J6W69_06180, partial [Bacteroidales bacterium]|nr:hypothetical protein [Bacteroidales bacterium]
MNKFPFTGSSAIMMLVALAAMSATAPSALAATRPIGQQPEKQGTLANDAMPSDTTQAQPGSEWDDASDFTFTESQLDEDLDAAQTISSVSSAASDPYRSNVGFTWSAMRFRVRALDNMYAESYLNGLAFNDLETGRFSYSLLGGLNDATRNREGASANDFNTFGIAGIAGGENTNLRASRFQQGQKVTVSLCNRNYKYRTVYTFGTGLLDNGWAFGVTVGYRGAKEGV